MVVLTILYYNLTLVPECVDRGLGITQPELNYLLHMRFFHFLPFEDVPLKVLG